MKSDELASHREPSAIRLQTGARIREFRNQRRLNQSALGELAGISRSTISLIEKGTHSQDIDSLNCIAQALGVAIHALLPPRNSQASTEDKTEIQVPLVHATGSAAVAPRPEIGDQIGAVFDRLATVIERIESSLRTGR